MKFIKLFVIFSIGTILFSCSKNSDRDQDTTINSSEDFALAQSLIYDAFKVVDQAAKSSEGISDSTLANSNSLFGCDSVKIDTSSSPMSLTVNFNGTCAERTGSITAIFSNKYDALGTITTVSFNDYSYRGFQIGSGTVSITYTNKNGTKPVYSYSTNAVKIINSSNIPMTFSCSQRITLNSGENTAITTDDSYSIAGSASGRTYKGNEYDATFTSDLTLSGDCKWINSGSVIISPKNKAGRTLNFGSSCDDKATVIVNSVEQEITIP